MWRALDISLCKQKLNYLCHLFQCGLTQSIVLSELCLMHQQWISLFVPQLWFATLDLCMYQNLLYPLVSHYKYETDQTLHSYILQ